MKLRKMGRVGMLALVMGLTSIAGVAQAAGHGCKNHTHWDPKTKQCLANHGCKGGEHWSPKEKQCVAK